MALALANDPALIFADEPTGNFDTGNTSTVTALFLSLAEKYGKTVIMASHDPKAREKFQKVYNMRDGNFVLRLRGTPYVLGLVCVSRVSIQILNYTSVSNELCVSP